MNVASYSIFDNTTFCLITYYRRKPNQNLSLNYVKYKSVYSLFFFLYTLAFSLRTPFFVLLFPFFHGSIFHFALGILLCSHHTCTYFFSTVLILVFCIIGIIPFLQFFVIFRVRIANVPCVGRRFAQFQDRVIGINIPHFFFRYPHSIHYYL